MWTKKKYSLPHNSIDLRSVLGFSCLSIDLAESGVLGCRDNDLGKQYKYWASSGSHLDIGSKDIPSEHRLDGNFNLQTSARMLLHNGSDLDKKT
jgi:hypothetical protein